MASGFYKVPHELHRALIRDADSFRVCLELRSRARWTPGPYLGSHGIIELAAGQCVIGRAELAAVLGLTEATIRTCLNRLARLGAITIESTKLGSIITIRDGEDSDEVSPANQPSAPGQINQAPRVESTNGSTTSEDLKKEDQKSIHTRARERHPLAGPIARRVWDHSAKVCGELSLANVKPLQVWPTMAGGDHPGWQLLLDRVCELLVGSTAEETERIARNRVDVAKAKALDDGDGQYFSPTGMFSANSFAHWAQLDPTQIGRKRVGPQPVRVGQRGAIGSATPNKNFGNDSKPAKEVM